MREFTEYGLEGNNAPANTMAPAGILDRKDSVPMKESIVDGIKYRLPTRISTFQRDMYVHLINWKWANITTDVGHYKYKGKLIPYDAILPDSYAQQGLLPHIYGPTQPLLASHRVRNPFRIHKHFYHMASSQAANINCSFRSFTRRWSTPFSAA